MMATDSDFQMAAEYQRQLDLLGPDPTDEQLAAALEWNLTHDWRAYMRAWRRYWDIT